ncbi:MAG: sugar-binding protein [Cytophagaceae bacterium]
MKNFYQLNRHFFEKAVCRNKNRFSVDLSMTVIITLAMMVISAGGYAQTVSGGWDAAGVTGGATGYTNYGSGVIQMLNTTNTGCSGAAVHETSSTYDPTGGTNFSKCYKLFFGCPGSDNIGSDANGDGMAFSFSKCAYNINNGSACGGGLGYMGSCPQMITIEFDTWSSQCNANFDCNYGGVGGGLPAGSNHDEISVHKDGNASDVGTLFSTDAGDLEDGLEHDVCITYTAATHILSVTIDGVSKLSYDLGPTYNLQTYFGAGGLNQTWSSGKFGATNPATVSDGAGIAATIGAPLCPAAAFITSPGGGTAIDPCNGPVTITASATTPAGNTISSMDILVDGVVIANDASAPYSTTWTPVAGSHSLTAIAHYTPSSTTATSAVTSITVGALNSTTSAPVIDGTIDASWSSYTPFTLAQGFNSAPDLAANYKIRYDATNLYLLVDVTDENVQNDGGNNWDNDGVEVFIDYGNDKSGGYGANDYQFGFVVSNATVNEYKHSATGGVTFSQGAKAGGYIMEIKFPWATIGGSAPAPGSYLGFDVGINDDDNNGGRDNQLTWHDGSFGEFNNTALFGTLPVSSCNPMPVTLITFTGDYENGNVVLSWATATEINNSKFIIERSGDLSAWNAIGEKTGAGNTTSIVHYSFADDEPLEGIAYYRLKQVDVNGNFVYSNIIAVGIEPQSVSIMPNPFDDVLNIRSNIKGNIDIFIYDLLGRLLYYTCREADHGTLSIQPDLASGAYVITLRAGSFIEQQKLIRK